MIDGGFKVIRAKGTPYFYSSVLPGGAAIYVETDPRLASVFIGTNAEQLIENGWILGWWQGDHMEAVPAPMCGCCGNSTSCTVKGWRRETRLTMIPGGYRCDKHVGRNPCIIEGCGKTYELKDGQDYKDRFICGFHWRQAPKHLRDRCAEIRKIAKRKGWSDARVEMHNRTWEEAVKIVQEGGVMDIAEIHRVMGWDAP